MTKNNTHEAAIMKPDATFSTMKRLAINNMPPDTISIQPTNRVNAFSLYLAFSLGEAVLYPAIRPLKLNTRIMMPMTSSNPPAITFETHMDFIPPINRP